MRLDVPPVPFYEGKDFFERSSLPLAVIHIEYISLDYPVHSHDFTELVIVYEGFGVHVSRSGERPIEPGDFFVVSPGDEHGYSDHRGLSYVNVLFDAPAFLPAGSGAGRFGACLGLLPDDGEYGRLSTYGVREALAMATRIDQEIFRKEPGYELAATASFFLLVSTLARACSGGGATGESTQERVRGLARRIERNSSLGLSVDEMAEEARTSPRNFRREFRSITGESPVSFVNRCRIDEARSLLLGTDKTITQIAFLVGFEDSAYFTRVFKRREGVSPSDYRARRSLQARSGEKQGAGLS
jgi:AraC-like DNA-binding protein